MIICTHVALQSWVSLFKLLLWVCCFHHHHHRGCTCGSKGSIVPTPMPECFIHRPIGRVLIANIKLCYNHLCYKAQMTVLQSTCVAEHSELRSLCQHLDYMCCMTCKLLWIVDEISYAWCVLQSTIYVDVIPITHLHIHMYTYPYTSALQWISFHINKVWKEQQWNEIPTK